MQSATSVVRYGSKAVRYKQAFGDLPGQSDQEEWDRGLADVNASLALESQAVARAERAEETGNWVVAYKHWGDAAAAAVAAAKALRALQPGAVFPFGTAGNVAAVLEKQATDAEKRAASHLQKRQDALKKGFTGTIRPRGPGDPNAGRGARGGASLSTQARPTDLLDSWTSGGRLTGRGLTSSAFVGEQVPPSEPSAPMSSGMKLAIGVGTGALVIGGLYYFLG